MAYLISKVIGISDVAPVLLGSILPDITFVSLIFFSKVFKINKHDVYVYAAPFHTPFMMILLSVAIAAVTTSRETAFFYLIIGATSHFILDLLAKGGSVELFYPFNMTPVSFKVFWPESIGGYVLLIGSSASLIFALLVDPLHLSIGFHFSLESILALAVISLLISMFVIQKRNLIREKYIYFKFSSNPELWDGKHLSFNTRYVQSVNPLKIDIANKCFEAVTDEKLEIGNQISFGANYSKGKLYIDSLHKHNTFLKTFTSFLGFSLFLFIIVF